MSFRLMSGNKGIFFSLTAILILVLLAMTLVGRQKFITDSESESLQVKFQVANTFMVSIENSILPRLLEADVALALEGIAKHINDSSSSGNPAFLDDEKTLTDAVSASVMGDASAVSDALGVSWASVAPLLNSSNMSAQIKELEELSEEQIHLKLKVNIVKIELWQDNTSGPRQVNANLTARVWLETETTRESDVLKWDNRLVNITAKVPVAHLDDPYIMAMAKSEGFSVDPNIRFSETLVNVTNLKGFIFNRTYLPENRSPSYMQRFYRDMSGSECCGIESPVGIDAAYSGVDVLPRPMVDWCYFEDDCRRRLEQNSSFWALIPTPEDGAAGIPQITSTTSGTPAYAFVLGDYQMNKYNITGYYEREATVCYCDYGRKDPVTGLPDPEWAGPGCIGPIEGEPC